MRRMWNYRSKNLKSFRYVLDRLEGLDCLVKQEFLLFVYLLARFRGSRQGKGYYIFLTLKTGD